jgi:hypothetical protein
MSSIKFFKYDKTLHTTFHMSGRMVWANSRLNIILRVSDEMGVTIEATRAKRS